MLPSLVALTKLSIRVRSRALRQSMQIPISTRFWSNIALTAARHSLLDRQRSQERSVSRYPPQNLKMPNRMGWLRWLPGLITLREYQASWLMHDITAGVVLATMLVPVGIAYAVASGVPGIYGLYATIVPLIAYALFGPSRILVLGPDSALVAIILGVVFPLSGGNALRAVALAGMMAVVSGVVCILAGVGRLGFALSDQ
jgi:Sulfate permease family